VTAPKLSGRTLVPWTQNPDTIGGVTVDQVITPTLGDVLTYDGSTWTNGTGGGGGVTSVSGTTPISSSGGATPAISLDANGVTDAKLRQGGALTVIGRSANSTGNVADIAASAASDAVLRESGSTIGFGTIATGGIAANAVTNAKIRQSGALAVVGRSANSTGDVADISAVAASDSVLRESGSTIGFGTIATGGIAANAVTDAKLRQGAARTVIGRSANSTGDVADIVASNASDAVLRESGGTIAFGTVATAGLAANAVTNAKIRQSGALAIIGRSANSTGDVADISASAASGAVLRESGSTIGFGTIATAGIADNAVTLAKLATQADYTWLGNISGASAVPTATALVYKTTTDPTLTSDTANGYFVGQTWVNTTGGRVWVCRDATTNAALWDRTGGPCSTLRTDAGTVGLWRFESNLNDSSGNSKTLTGTGAFNYAGGLSGRLFGVFISGTNSATRTSESTFNLTTTQCITALVNIAQTATAQTIVQYGPNGNSRTYFLDIAATANRMVLNWGYGTGAATVTTVANSLGAQWILIHATRSVSGGSSTSAIYVNGTLLQSDVVASVPTSNASGTIYIGCNATSATTQTLNNGQVAGIRLSSTVPSAAQIKLEAQLYHPYAGIAT
jgi:hypothetical protein